MVLTDRKFRKLQEQCDKWNKEYPVGTEVILTDDLGEKHLTRTIGEASVLGDHTAVIWTELKHCYQLDRIRVNALLTDKEIMGILLDSVCSTCQFCLICVKEEWVMEPGEPPCGKYESARKSKDRILQPWEVIEREVNDVK